MLWRESPFAECAYRSRFRDWNTQSAVRAKPLPSFAPDAGRGKLFFTPELVPLATHPAILERGPDLVERILALHLFGHLNFTDTLENEVVAPVAYMIGRCQLGFSLPPAMLNDARRIAIDEMHHALFAAGFTETIAALSGVEPPAPRRPLFLRRLDEMIASQDPAMAPFMKFFFAVVSETLITGTLTRVPSDERVVGGVRTMLRDHAEDEARHHAYFADALAFAWPQLATPQRAAVGPLLPRFIAAYLAPDLGEVQDWLERVGFSAGEAKKTIEESYAPTIAAATFRRAAETPLRLMKRAGVLDDPLTADAFHASGLMA